MLSLPVVFDYWRNYKPEAPNLDWVISDQNSRTLKLNFLKIQGARDPSGKSPTAGILDKVPAQRGWSCVPMVVGEPSHGTVRVNDTGDAFIYTPRAGYEGFDCFNYVITNGTQQSDLGKVTLDVRPWYKHKIIALRTTPNKNRHEFNLVDDFPAGLPKIHMQTYEWTYTTVQGTKIDGVTRVLPHTDYFNTRIGTYVVGEECRVAVNFIPFTHNTKAKLTLDTPDDSLDGFDGYSNLLYQPKKLRGHLKVKVKLYYASKLRKFNFTCWRSIPTRYLTIEKEVLDLDTYHELEYDFEEIFGERWADSGNILIPGIKY